MIALEVGSLEEAKKAVSAGVDAIIVQGREAGGHVIGQVSMLLVSGRIAVYLCSYESVMAFC